MKRRLSDTFTLIALIALIFTICLAPAKETQPCRWEMQRVQGGCRVG